MIVIGIRIAVGFVVLAIVGVAATPLLVLRDLSNGGSGFGLCSEGVGACANSYFAGFELFAALMLALFLLLGGLAILVKALRMVQKHQALKAAGVPTSFREFGNLWNG